MRSKTSAAAALFLLASLPARAVDPCAFTLLSPTSDNTNSMGSDISAGDVNNDGYVDVIVVNEQMDTYSLLLGNPMGGFLPYTAVDVTDPSAVVVADFNGDHKDDFVLATGSGGTSRVKVYVSNGNGTFIPGTPIVGPQYSNQLVVADFNEDGKLDVAAAGTPGVELLLGDGGSTFSWGGTIDLGVGIFTGQAISLAVTDFNNDGHVDLVAGEINTGVVALIGTGHGGFAKKPVMSVGSLRPEAVMGGDFDGDGNSDILVGLYGSNSPQPLKLFTGNGDGTFDPAVDRASIQNVFKAAAVDIDNDGDPDALMTSNGTPFTVMRNDGAGNFISTPFTSVPPGGFPYALVTADVDRDGGPDVLITDFINAKVKTLLNHCGVATLEVTSSANPSNLGSNVTITATVVSPPAATATGTLALTEDGPIVATGSVPSPISRSNSDLTLGAHTYVGSYSGDSRFYPGTTTLIQTVQPGPFGPPPHMVATAVSTTSIGVTWWPTAGVDHYEIQRGTSPGTLGTIGTSAAANYTDDTATAGNVYVYRVRGIAPDLTPSAFSNSDLASTFVFTDPTLTPGLTTIKALHLSDLRAAVNAARGAAGLGAAGWTDSALEGVAVKAVHVNEVRTALDQARSALGMAALMYTDPSIAPGVTVILGAHFAELRAGVQ